MNKVARNKVIEHQHADLHRISSNISLNLNNHAKLGKLFIELYHHIVEHCKAEEDYMRDISYPQIEEHICAHRIIIERIKRLNLGLDNFIVSDRKRHITNELFNYIENHGKDHDAPLGRYITANVK